MELWGLDLETSGSNLDFSATIQLGLYRPNHAYCRTIGGWTWVDTEHEAALLFGQAYWHPEAAGVHNIPVGKVNSSPAATTVDFEAAQFVDEKSTTRRKKDRWVVGWNVKGFDMPFVERDLPSLYEMFSYRSVDLNAVTAAVVGKPGPDGEPWTYPALKAFVKTRAEENAKSALKSATVIGEKDYRAHNAGFDAVTALHSYHILRRIIQQ